MLEVMPMSLIKTPISCFNKSMSLRPGVQFNAINVEEMVDGSATLTMCYLDRLIDASPNAHICYLFTICLQFRLLMGHKHFDECHKLRLDII